MLRDVLLELEPQRFLVGGELLPVMERQVDGVLVRDVDAGHGDRAVVVHLLGELAGDLDGLHVRLERASEHALDECFDLVFDRAENAQRPRLPEFRVYRRPVADRGSAGRQTAAVVSSTGWLTGRRRGANACGSRTRMAPVTAAIKRAGTDGAPGTTASGRPPTTRTYAPAASGPRRRRKGSAIAPMDSATAVAASSGCAATALVTAPPTASGSREPAMPRSPIWLAS